MGYGAKGYRGSVSLEMEERRGPEYVSAAEWSARRHRKRRRLTWIVSPMLGTALAIAFVQVWMPQRTAASRIARLSEVLSKPPPHRIHEYRITPEREELLRMDMIAGPMRKTELYDGEIVLLSTGDGPATAYERAANRLRDHQGTVLVKAATARLLSDCTDLQAKVVSRSPTSISVQLRDKRHEILLGKSGYPRAWTTYYETDRGMEPLSKTLVEWSGVDWRVDPEAFAAQEATQSAYRVTPDEMANPYDENAVAVAEAGEVTILRAEVSRLGDLVIAYRSSFERPYFEVSDGTGAVYGAVPLYDDQTRTADGTEFINESLAVRLGDAPKWPLRFSITIRNYDPRIGAAGTESRVVGTWATKFAAPSAWGWPQYWFIGPMTDRPYYSFERNRAYYRSLMYQNALRRPNGELVLTINGSTEGVPNPAGLHRQAGDAVAAIRDLRDVLRMRAEYDGGRLSVAQMYLTLAQLEIKAGRKDDARRTLAYLSKRPEVDSDLLLAEDIGQLAKEFEE